MSSGVVCSFMLYGLFWRADDVLFFFKQKTAYDMRISDWSSDVCSSDLLLVSVALGVLTAYLFFRSWPRRLLFVALSVAVPIVANGIRAYGIIMLAHLSGYKLAVDVDHVIYGFVFLGIVARKSVV